MKIGVRLCERVIGLRYWARSDLTEICLALGFNRFVWLLGLIG